MSLRNVTMVCLVCLMGLLEWNPVPRLWIEWDLWWQQTSWRTAAADVREKLELFWP